MPWIRSRGAGGLLAWSLVSFIVGAFAPALAQASAETVQDVSLEDAVRLALGRDASLAPALEELRAREADAMQSGRRPNPVARIALENAGGSGSFAGLDQAETTFELSQTWEIGGKRSKRAVLGHEDATAALGELEERRNDVVLAVRVAFAALLAAQERAVLSEELTRAERSAAESVAERVRIGGAPAAEEARARLALAQAELAQARVARALDASRRELAARWGGLPAVSRARGELGAADELEPLEVLLARIDESPAMRAARSGIDREEAAYSLERALAVPDLLVSGGVRRFEDKGATAFLAGVGFPLPLFDRRAEAKGAAVHRLSRARADSAAVRTRVESRLRSLHAELAGSYEEVAALRDVLLPQARVALQSTEDAYSKGLLRLSEVLEARRTLFELTGRLLDAQLDTHVLHADLDRELGNPEARIGLPEIRP